MIDSIIFRVNDLAKHERLVELLHKKNLEGQSYHLKEMEGQDLQDYHDNHSKRIYFERYFIDHQNGKSFEAGYRNFIKSSHYHIAYHINFTQGYIEFNFSIPKYLFGTNILQFVPHYPDKEYRDFQMAGFEAIAASTYERFRKFLDWFFNKECFGFVDPYCVRFMRLDLCYNKVFNTQYDAMYYLSELKRIKKKYLRDTSKANNEYHTGVYYPSRDCTLKIYHKGAEFRANDRPKMKWLTPFQSEFFQEFADRMLRYECEFRAGFLDRVFKNVLFRPKAEYWIAGKRMNKQIETTGGYCKVKGEKIHYTRLSNDRKQCIKYFKAIDNKTFGFFVKSGSKFYQSDFPVSSAFEFEQKFSEKMFKLLVKKFKAFYDHFQVTFDNDFLAVLSGIESQFKDVKRQGQELRRIYLASGGKMPDSQTKLISFSKCRNILMALRTDTWKQIREKTYLSESVFYRYKKFFSTFGVGEVASQILIPIGSDGYLDYHKHLERHLKQLALPEGIKARYL